jgi:hypothetical protein
MLCFDERPLCAKSGHYGLPRFGAAPLALPVISETSSKTFFLVDTFQPRYRIFDGSQCPFGRPCNPLSLMSSDALRLASPYAPLPNSFMSNAASSSAAF